MREPQAYPPLGYGTRRYYVRTKRGNWLTRCRAGHGAIFGGPFRTFRRVRWWARHWRCTRALEAARTEKGTMIP